MKFSIPSYVALAMLCLPSATKAEGSKAPPKCTGPCAAQVVLLSYSGCVLGTDGDVACWNLRGHPRDESKPLVRKVEGLPPVKRLATNRNTTVCAVTRDGEVYCWGGNPNGLMTGGVSEELLLTPRKVAGFSQVESVAIAPRATSICAVRTDGTVSCMGFSERNWGSTQVVRAKTPTQLPELSGVLKMEMSNTYSCFLFRSGAVKCVGENYWAELGIGEKGGVKDSPTDVPGLGHVTDLSVSSASANCATNQAGEVYCWGRNLYGEHGDGTTDVHLSPVRVEGVQDAQSVSVGDKQTCALTQSGDVYCWGAHFLGDGKEHASPMPPQKVASMKTASSIVSGQALSCAIVDGQAPWCWGAPTGHGTRAPSVGLPMQIDWQP